MKLSYFPQIKVVHTSKVFYGQLYVPLINWLLMVGTVLVASIFNNVQAFHLSEDVARVLIICVDDVSGECLRLLCHVCHIL